MRGYRTYKGQFKPKNPSKYKGDHTKITYRSLWERVLMVEFDENPNVILWSSEEIVIPYRSPKDKRVHRYYPDFYVKKVDASTGKISETIIEVKPYAQTIPPKPVKGKPTKRMLTEIETWGVNEAKWRSAESFCADRKWNFVKITENELGIRKKSKTPKKRK